MIKWPNDVVINGKKVCGILAEMSASSERIHYVIVGVGMNVNQEDFPKELEETATSLKREAGRSFRIEKILGEFLRSFENFYEIFEESEGFEGLREKYEVLLINKGRQVRILGPRGEALAVALGVDENGRLIVEKDGGKREKICAGEVSVRGVYGYV